MDEATYVALNAQDRAPTTVEAAEIASAAPTQGADDMTPELKAYLDAKFKEVDDRLNAQGALLEGKNPPRVVEPDPNTGSGIALTLPVMLVPKTS